ncbi:MAG: heavy metal translocating P-type ATPase [Thermoflexales bacterium]|nr:heavy metal translocating P-type ATPase [Thermoflexales bacterium]MDW8352250.1 heavy metal translocating P-type ATPase [Anaerolineae bacterium]
MAAPTQAQPSTPTPPADAALLLLSRARAWLTPLRVEAICVAITFVAMMAGLITSNTSVNPTLPALFYLIAYISGGAFGLQAGVESLRRFRIDVDLLMILAALGAVVVGSPFEGAMLLFLFSLSNVLQAYALGRTRSAIQALMKLRPDRALVKREGGTVLMPIEQLVVGDHILVRPGERVPLDGIVVEGESTLDQSSLTGESMPVNKRVGDPVFAGTVNQSGSLEVQVTKLARDSTIARLIKMVEEAQSQKAPTERFLDKFEQVYAVGVILFTLLLIVVPPVFFGAPFEASLYRAITVMVVASPCALIISTPAAILSAIANGARRGVLFKGGAHLERAGQLDVIAFDKTGTLTVGKPTVTDVTIIPMNVSVHDDQSREGADAPHPPRIPEHIRTEQENILLALAAAVESKSEHPLALAIVETARHRGLNIPEATDFVNTAGKGVRAKLAFMGGLTIAIGNPRYFDGYQTIGMERAMREVVRLQDEGKTSVLVAKISDGVRANILGVIAIADVVRPSAPGVIRRLHELGIKRTVMLTGDNERVARAVARQTGVDEVYADLLPEDKVAQIKRLREGATRPNAVAMVGDGVNDAPALASASLGIAMGAAGTDVALETADVVLMSDDLRNIPYAISLSRQARRVVVQNLAFAIAVIILLVIAALGLELPLPAGVVGHEGSTVIVVLNGLRLLMFSEKIEK